MATWAEFAAEQPDLAAFVQSRFAADRHALIATLRKDGSPRISGVEPDFTHGEVWAGMMPASLKSRDLRRDPSAVELAAAVDFAIVEAQYVATQQQVAAALIAIRDNLARMTSSLQ